MTVATSTVSKRVLSIDILRGIVMVIMALDHTRDYFSDYIHNPVDLNYASTAMFITRWITHFCAPVFVFLSGASAYLSLSKGKSTKQASLFLLKRGLWLILLEFTIVRFGWMFNLDFTRVFVQVIWAIGCSMVVLSGLIFLPFRTILTFGLLLIFGHNAFDDVHADLLGNYGPWWNVLHEFGRFDYAEGYTFVVLYPLIPWIGVMATGYCFGRIFQLEEEDRNRWLYAIGGVCVGLFFLLRGLDVYGDPLHWSVQPTWWRTILSFVNCEKYPPSLLYLLMTIGPSILIMPWLEKMQNRVGGFFTVYGRVPLFFYILHIYVIHLLAMIGASFHGLPLHLFTNTDTVLAPKPGWGFSLPYVYACWVFVILLLYWPCRWFMNVKMNHKKWWLSYL